MVACAGIGLEGIVELFSAANFSEDLNAQSVVEIVLARITSAIRYLVSLLESIYPHYSYSLIEGRLDRWRSGLVDSPFASTDAFVHPLGSGSPHARLVSDLLAFLYLHYTNGTVMAAAIPPTIALLQVPLSHDFRY